MKWFLGVAFAFTWFSCILIGQFSYASHTTNHSGIQMATSGALFSQEGTYIPDRHIDRYPDSITVPDPRHMMMLVLVPVFLILVVVIIVVVCCHRYQTRQSSVCTDSCLNSCGLKSFAVTVIPRSPQSVSTNPNSAQGHPYNPTPSSPVTSEAGVTSVVPVVTQPPFSGEIERVVPEEDVPLRAIPTTPTSPLNNHESRPLMSGSTGDNGAARSEQQSAVTSPRGECHVDGNEARALRRTVSLPVRGARGATGDKGCNKARFKRKSYKCAECQYPHSLSVRSEPHEDCPPIHAIRLSESSSEGEGSSDSDVCNKSGSSASDSVFIDDVNNGASTPSICIHMSSERRPIYITVNGQTKLHVGDTTVNNHVHHSSRASTPSSSGYSSACLVTSPGRNSSGTPCCSDDDQVWV